MDVHMPVMDGYEVNSKLYNSLQNVLESMKHRKDYQDARL